MMKNYGKENFLSVWVGRCKNINLFNEYIRYNHSDDESRFKLGKDFGIFTYDEDFSLVYYNETSTDNVKVLLDTGVPDYVIEHFSGLYGENLSNRYNCCVMFYDMKYDGTVKNVVNPDFGEFYFLGCMEADKFDLL